MEIAKGDYLTFASIATALGIDSVPFKKCEVESGVWRRHWELQQHESRSDISRDGYMGVVLYAVLKKDNAMLDRIISAGWKRMWKMGEYGNWDYVSMLPMVPMIYAARYKWLPNIPAIMLPKYDSGYRAHLLALYILIDMECGRSNWSHRRTLTKLVEANPNNPWFKALYNRAHGKSQDDVHRMMDSFDNSESAYGWGSCPGPVFRALVEQSIV